MNSLHPRAIHRVRAALRGLIPLSVLLVLALLPCQPAHALVGVATTNANDWPFPPGAEFDDELRRVIPEGLRNAADAGDLINIGQATLSGISGTAVADGFHNGVTMESGFIQVDFGANVGAGTETIFTLNTTLNPQGYDINRIWLMFGNKFTGDRRDYTMWYSVVGDANWTFGGSNFSGAMNNNFVLANWGTDTWFDGTFVGPTFTATGETMWTGVDAVRFVWNTPAPPNNYSYKVWEIDVQGAPSAAVPEPATLSLALIGLAGLGWGRIRCRRK